MNPGKYEYDIIVAGGGMTGVGAALSAGRAGARVLLVEQYGCLGGMATVGHVNPFMTHYFYDRAYPGQETVLGIYHEILDRLARESPVLEEWRSEDGQLQNPPPHKPRLWPGNKGFDSEVLKWVLDEMMEEAGVKVRFHTFISKVRAEDKRISSIESCSKSGIENFAARQFIDCTGDADLAALAGFETIFGRESDGKAQALTLMFRLGDIDLENADLGQAQAAYREAVASGELKMPGKRQLLMFPYPGKGVVTFNQNELAGLDSTNADDLSRGEILGRKAVREIVAFLRKNAPGFEHCRVEMLPQQVGVRESRRIIGEYILNVNDLLNRVHFEDVIACGAYPVDIHDPEGKMSKNPMQHLEPGTYYQIPFRSLIPKGAQNLLVGGRCLSATHEAAASVRVMPICAAMGQAAGIAAARACNADEAISEINIAVVQDELRKAGAFLPAENPA